MEGSHTCRGISESIHQQHNVSKTKNMPSSCQYILIVQLSNDPNNCAFPYMSNSNPQMYTPLHMACRALPSSPQKSPHRKAYSNTPQRNPALKTTRKTSHSLHIAVHPPRRRRQPTIKPRPPRLRPRIAPIRRGGRRTHRQIHLTTVQTRLGV